MSSNAIFPPIPNATKKPILSSCGDYCYLPFVKTADEKLIRYNELQRLINVGGAILSWIIEGARKVLLDNFRAFKDDASNPFAVAPKAVQALVDNYDYSSANSGSIAAFISDYCKVGDDYEVSSREIHS